MGNLFSEERKHDEFHRIVKSWSEKDDNGNYVRQDLVRHMEPPPTFNSSDNMRDDRHGQDAYEGCRKFMQSAAAKSAVWGPEGFSNMSRIEGAREAVIAALKEYHPGFFEAMPKRKDGLPDQRYGGINAVYAVMGQYMPVLNKDGSLHRGCRVYKIILQEAGIDYNTLTERESHDLYKYWNGRDPNTDMIRNPRLASALRMAHSVKHIGSLDAGHANCLLYLAGLKNEKKEEDRGRQGNTIAARTTNARSPYVHFGVGCDGCGAFPIRGAAFRCLDCPDDVGFDLCAECHSSPLVVTGRFDQGHTSNHRVVEREQVRTPLHELQAANPQLGVHEVLDIARMQLQAAAPPPPDDSSSDDESFSRYGPGDPPRTA